MPDLYPRFIALIREISALGGARMLLSWDQEICLPPKGVPGRARQLAALAGVIHEKVCDEELGTLIAELSAASLEPVPAANVREAKRERDRAVKLPASLVRELSEASSLARDAWLQARTQDDWSLFAPRLETLIGLKRREAEAVGYAGEIYNALLDEYEPGARVEEVAAVFDGLKAELVPLLGALMEAPDQPDDSVLRRTYDVGLQERIGREVLTAMGYDFEAGRLDVSAHPFTEGMDVGDVRITTRYHEDDLTPALYASLHEGGHALYEQGLPAAHAGTPVATAVSLGIHESQSRLWENCVGRSREFLAWILPRLRELFPEQLGGTELETLYRAVNRVAPSLIRIEADEVTYSLHIILRMELERALLRGDAAVNDLPTLWNERMREDLGVAPANDAEGVLQDIHWSFGLFGYFPTYALGNLYAAQLFRAAADELPDLRDGIARGEFRPLLDWLRERIHRRGRALAPRDLIRAATGRPLDVADFADSLSEKFGALYSI